VLDQEVPVLEIVLTRKMTRKNCGVPFSRTRRSNKMFWMLKSKKNAISKELFCLRFRALKVS